MKKLNIYMPKLKYGGMELSLINFINTSNITKNYDTNLYLVYCGNPELIDLVKDKVNVHLMTNKWNILGKMKAAFKLLLLFIKQRKSDVNICYSNHHKILSILSRKNTKSSILFVHSDLNRYETDEEKINIKNKINFDKFDKIICVSETVKNSIAKLYNEDIKNKCYVVANYVDGEKILKLSKEKINDKINFKIPTFISIANHNEKYKNINAIIDTTSELKKDNYKFQVLLIGKGEDTQNYINRINDLNLNDYILLLGSKSNPYPYLKESSALVFTSRYEGYGMVLDEARVLNIPIISTGSGASYEICKDGYGVVTNNIKEEMIKIIENKNKKEKIKFDYKKHNQDITNKYDEIIN